MGTSIEEQVNELMPMFFKAEPSRAIVAATGESALRRCAMETSLTRIQWVAAGAALLAASAVLAAATFGTNRHEVGAAVTPVRVEKLSDVPGKTLTVVTVNYAPGGKSGVHHHAGSVFAYVLSGEIRSENSATGPVKVYKAGESFFEPSGSEHLVSENASATEPASMLAVFIADDGAQLTVFDK